MSLLMLFLAILPAVVLIVYVYKKDTVEKEPPKLLASLFLCGVLTIIPVVFVELALGAVLLPWFGEESIPYLVIDNFIVVALIEELGKYLVFKWRAWRSPHFNYLFDAIVYAVVISLGFATAENILYVLDGGFSTAVMRAILSVPGHAIDGVFMGYFFGLAKRAELAGNAKGCKTNLVFALLIPAVVHGFYDFYISAGYFILFIVFEIAVTAVAIVHVRRTSKGDEQL